MPSRSSDVNKIEELAQTILRRKRLQQPQPIVLMGAGTSISSGCPTLEELLDQIARRLGRPDITKDPAEMEAQLRRVSIGDNDMYSHLSDLVVSRTPSRGYYYLASLVADGYFETFLTLNFDSLLEDSLAQYIRPSECKVLVRGEHDDGYIARALRFRPPRVKIVKLHGDVNGRSAMLTSDSQLRLDEVLERALSDAVSDQDIIVLGTRVSDPDLLSLLNRASGVIWCVDPSAIDRRSQMWRVMHGKGMSENTVHGSCAKFDNFLSAVSLSLRRMESATQNQSRNWRLSAQVREATELEVLGYTDSLVRRFSRRLAEEIVKENSTLLVYVHDPKAPGGTEIEKRLKLYLHHEANALTGREVQETRLNVFGDDIRWINRTAGQLTAGSTGQRFDQVIVIDSISFTGNTMELATSVCREAYPHAAVKWALLVVAQPLFENIEKLSIERDDVVSLFSTSRHDFFFPWGWTQATGNLQRVVDLAERSHVLETTPRPWGTIERLASNDRCSVRVHHIQPGHRMSLQRHFLRDGIFVTLDNNAGIEFESEKGEVLAAARLPKGERIVVRRGELYRFAAYRDTTLILEISFGYYDETYDIERIHDDYGRVRELGDV